MEAQLLAYTAQEFISSKLRAKPQAAAFGLARAMFGQIRQSQEIVQTVRDNGRY